MKDSIFISVFVLLVGIKPLHEKSVRGLFPACLVSHYVRSIHFITTTKVLTAAIKRGMGREDAHERIRDHAFDVVRDMREHGLQRNDLLERLGNDPEIPMTYTEIMEAIDKPVDLTGRASTQVIRFVDAARSIVKNSLASADYKPNDIL